MTTSSTDPSVTRRTVLRGAAGVATAGLAANVATPVAAQSADEPDYGGWFDDVDNYDGTVDATGEETVTITVGAEGNGGGFAFDPAAVRVDPGTEIVWEWSGNGGVHNVAAEDGSFESELVDEAGHTFEYTADREGIVEYACVPHKAMGMKGALVVGDAAASAASDGNRGENLVIGGGLGLVGVLMGMFVVAARGSTRRSVGKR